MPKFLHQNDPDLSDLNRSKKTVNRDYAKQYQSQDGNHDNLGQTADVDSIYNTLSTRLTALLTSLLDFSQQLNSPVAINLVPILAFNSRSVGALQQLASRILTEIRAVNAIFGRIKSFNMFTPLQASALQQSVQEINDAHNTIIGASQQLGGSPTAQQIDEIISSFNDEFLLLSQFLTGASNNYMAVEMRGGAIVPAFNGEGVFGSDGYRIGDYYTYNDPRRFY